MRRLTALFAVSLALALLAACGQKGPLYMPNNPHPPVYVPPKPQPAPATSTSAPASSASSEQD